MAKRNFTPEELEATLGENVREYRLSLNITRESLANTAGVSLSALRSLENGTGSTIRTLVCVLRAINRESWIDTLAPSGFNPLTMPRDSAKRQRATSPSSSGRRKTV
ncbi:helix-turn-helix domain-containing protein [Herbaspirillum huttiense]|uniref:helix-turn-helix domain-containing protein n=1 Tax=Herbaspirillum huttiense TaxID=863372 RepID=UPI0039B0A62C